MPEREKGVASVACPNCGSALALRDQPDGSVAAEACPSCHPAEAREQAVEAPQEPKVETAKASRQSRERGTTIDQQEEN